MLSTQRLIRFASLVGLVLGVVGTAPAQQGRQNQHVRQNQRVVLRLDRPAKLDSTFRRGNKQSHIIRIEQGGTVLTLSNSKVNFTGYVRVFEPTGSVVLDTSLRESSGNEIFIATPGDYVLEVEVAERGVGIPHYLSSVHLTKNRLELSTREAYLDGAVGVRSKKLYVLEIPQRGTLYFEHLKINFMGRLTVRKADGSSLFTAQLDRSSMSISGSHEAAVPVSSPGVYVLEIVNQTENEYGASRIMLKVRFET